MNHVEVSSSYIANKYYVDDKMVTIYTIPSQMTYKRRNSNVQDSRCPRLMQTCIQSAGYEYLYTAKQHIVTTYRNIFCACIFAYRITCCFCWLHRTSRPLTNMYAHRMISDNCFAWFFCCVCVMNQIKSNAAIVVLFFLIICLCLNIMGRL